jgi:nitric oxide reductase large subunit
VNKHILFAFAFTVIIIAILVNIYQIYHTPPSDFIKFSQLYISLGFLFLLLILLIFVYIAYLLLRKEKCVEIV